MLRFDAHAHAIHAETGPAAREAATTLMAHQGFAGSVPGAGWSIEGALEFMDERGIAMQLLSMPAALDAERARQWNRQTAAVVAAHPDRFGLLAALPMAQPDRAVEEITFALDELNADGFAVATNYDGLYLGDPRFDAVFAELNRHRSTLFVHPALPPGFDRLGLSRPGPLIEYPMDTARTIVDAVFAGVLLRYPDVALLLAHAGGVLPTLQQRIALLGVEPWVANPLQLTSDQIREQLAVLYLDTAIAGSPANIGPALEMVGIEHIVFGTDYPPAGLETIDQTVADLTKTLPRQDRDLLEGVFRRLFPNAGARASSPIQTTLQRP